MPNQTNAALSGAASGASAGAAFGPWGAAIGGVLGAAGGLMGGSGPLPPTPTQISGPTSPGATSNQYAGVYYNPYTRAYEQVGYGFNPYTAGQQTDVEVLYNQFMGYGNERIGSQFEAQAKQLRDEIARLQTGSASKDLDMGRYVDQRFIDPKTGKPFADKAFGFGHANNVPREHPVYQMFARETGGKYGSDNAGISFAKWLNDVYTKNIQPNWDRYNKDTEGKVGSDEVRNKAIKDLQAQLGWVESEQKRYGIDPKTGVASEQPANPLMSMLKERQQLPATYLESANRDLARQYEVANKFRDQQMARRGMLSSSMNEIGRAGQMGELADARARNAYNAAQLGGQVLGENMNFWNQLNNVRQGQSSQNLNQFQAGLQGASMLGNWGQNMASNWDAVNAANAQQENAFNMAGYQNKMTQQQQTQQSIMQGLGGMAQGLGSYYGRQPNNPFTSGYVQGLQTGGINTVPVSQGFQSDAITAMPKKWGS